MTADANFTKSTSSFLDTTPLGGDLEQLTERRKTSINQSGKRVSRVVRCAYGLNNFRMVGRFSNSAKKTARTPKKSK